MHRQTPTQATRDVITRARAFGFRLVFQDDGGSTSWAWHQDGHPRSVRFPSRRHALDYIEDRLRRSTYFA